MNKNIKFHKDLLAFARYVWYNDTMDDSKKLAMLVSTLGHDLNGIINEDKFFSPRCSGYSKLEQR